MMTLMILFTCFEFIIKTLTTIMVPLVAMISYGLENTFFRVIVIYGIRRIIYHVQRCLVFSAYRATSTIIGIGDAEGSWGDVKTMKYVKRSDISSNISEKQSIVYTSACIESGRIARSESDYNIDDLQHHQYQ